MNLISPEKRAEFWNFLVSEKTDRPKGVTAKRLEKIKDSVIEDDGFWFQVISRFGAEFISAREFYVEENRSRSDHSRGNFWSMVRERIVK